MTTWEYLKVDVPPDDWKLVCDSYGGIGWELVHMVWIPPVHVPLGGSETIMQPAKGTACWYCFFKRQKEMT